MPLKQPTDLVRKIEKAGYYPALVEDVLDIALAGEEVLAHLVHAETTFDLDTIRRHLSVVVLTPGRLIFVHADDHGGDEEHGDEAHGIASSESVPLSAVRSVMVAHVVAQPEKYRPGSLGRSRLTLRRRGTADGRPGSCAGVGATGQQPDPGNQCQHRGRRTSRP